LFSSKWADTVNDLNLNKFPGFLKQMLAGTGYSQWGFEGRVTNAVYNLARFLAEKVM